MSPPAGWAGIRWPGAERPHPDLSGLPQPVEALTATPRKYGFHGTLKPPFHLAPGRDAAMLADAVGSLAARLAPVTLPGLAFQPIGGFLALVPEGDTAPLAALASEVVRGLDRFRAPADAAEIARRRPERLSDRQRAHLAKWGYPYVMDEFRFHLTLTGNVGAEAARATAEVLRPVLAPLLPRPFEVNALCLFGEAADGRFHLLHRYTLSA